MTRKTLYLILLLFLPMAHVMGQNHPIGSRSITFTDPDRNNRQIATNIYYPAVTAGTDTDPMQGQFPVVVIGHGFAMPATAYANWWEHLVPLGFIVALPTTESSLIPAPSHADFGLDLAFVAMQLQLADADGSSPFFGHVLQRAALMGHSMGGGATVLGASGNANISCAIGLAPAETDPSAIAAAATVTAPVLFLQGTSDNVTPEEDNALAVFEALASSCKLYARIDNGSHCYFANTNFNCDFGEISVGGPGSLGRTEQHEVSFALATPFLQYFLLDDCDAYDALMNLMQTSPALATNVYGCLNEAPVISENGGVLESTSAPNYQWYLNGEPLEGETAQQHSFSQAGSYEVATVNIGQCPVFSNAIVIDPVGMVSPESTFLMRQMPQGIALQSASEHQDVSIRWFDTTGRLLHEESLQDLHVGQRLFLNIPDARGIKLLYVISGSSKQLMKVF